MNTRKSANWQLWEPEPIVRWLTGLERNSGYRAFGHNLSHPGEYFFMVRCVGAGMAPKQKSCSSLSHEVAGFTHNSTVVVGDWLYHFREMRCRHAVLLETSQLVVTNAQSKLFQTGRSRSKTMDTMIRLCKEEDFEDILTIINDGASAYRGIIPADRWSEPYMTNKKLRHEIQDGVVFWGAVEDGSLQAVMGVQNVLDVTLIRHAYVRTSRRRSGLGSRLLLHLQTLTRRRVLIGTWADATWAIEFYEKYGFRLVPAGEKDQLLERYWNIPARQVETSVVLSSKQPVPN